MSLSQKKSIYNDGDKSVNSERPEMTPSHLIPLDGLGHPCLNFLPRRAHKPSKITQIGLLYQLDLGQGFSFSSQQKNLYAQFGIER